ncbi:sodium:solute symporter [Aeromicrobium sp. Root344]|uniref:monocarboxylate uptake permease MctP n=1 Tax=Aeromicrobium sp. Root344 TaxID=1736521 RepID=UPI0006F92D9F|nr:sodium:solute symporter [Aeromicrobium sp. Root344]KQV75815.1 sodium:solute symporter [Aeromicrobium sp. Root344]
MNDVDPVSLSIFLFFFLLVTVLGFLAARWRKAETLDNLDEWGLGGRSFGTFVAWFLIGGDIYTAYTFIAVPALLYAGNATGFFAVPYTIILYPIIFIFLPRLWSVSHRRAYVTPADFVQGRFDSRGLSLAIAFTGILATLPYIALQLVGIQAVLDVMGLGGGEDASWFRKDIPLFVAFALLAAYTYSSGLRAPALIAFVKDTLIYLVIIVAVIYLPTQLGGWSGIFDSAGKAFDSFNKDSADAIAAGEARPKGLIPGLGVSQWAYATLSLGSALALFMYPHSVTAVLSTKNRNIIRRNAALLPAYSFLLGLLALLGIAAVAAGIQVKNPQLAIPQLFEQEFSPWFAGVAFAAIVIGAFVPAAIMSIAAANLWTRNIYKAFLNPGATDAQEAKQSKLASLLVKFGALLFVLALPKDFAINLQLLGGIWILQTLPAIVIGLYTRWFHRYALIAGWAIGMVWGTVAAYNTPVVGDPGSHFGGSVAPLEVLGVNLSDNLIYFGLTALVLNLIVAAVGTVICRALDIDAGTDDTHPTDYLADAGDPEVVDRLDPLSTPPVD